MLEGSCLTIQLIMANAKYLIKLNLKSGVCVEQ